MHAYWAPNAWALYLFSDRVSLAALKLVGVAGATVGKGSTTGEAARPGQGDRGRGGATFLFYRREAVVL